MSAKQYCRECNQLLIKNAERCACGWHADKTSVTDHRCQYRSNGRRCPLPGTMCPYPYGNTPWYCQGHWSCIGDSRLGDAVLFDAEENYQKILVKRRDWHVSLFNVESGKL